MGFNELIENRFYDDLTFSDLPEMVQKTLLKMKISNTMIDEIYDSGLLNVIIRKDRDTLNSEDLRNLINCKHFISVQTTRKNQFNIIFLKK